MSNSRKKSTVRIIILSLTVFVFLAGFCFILYRIMNLRTYQFFGRIYTNIITDRKIVALTFDDGPQPVFTDKILDILTRQNIKATFFLTGNEIADNPEECYKIVKTDNEIGNHTYSHKRMVFKSWKTVSYEIEQTDRLIRELGYAGPITFRPPFGKKLFILPYYLMTHHKITIMWNLEPDSIKNIADNPVKMEKYVDKNIRPGSIILFHVMNKNRTASMDAVEQVIIDLKNRGYDFVTVSELLQYGKDQQ